MMIIFPLAQKQFRYFNLNSIHPPSQEMVQRLHNYNGKLEVADQKYPHETETSESKNENNSEIGEPRSKTWEYA